MKLCERLSINLKYYRQKYKLSQERLAEILGTSLSYINQIENNKIDIKASTIDRFAHNLNNYTEENISVEDLIIYKKEHITNYNRIDEKKLKKV